MFFQPEVNRVLQATVWLLEIEPRSSIKAVNDLNCRAISLVPLEDITNPLILHVIDIYSVCRHQNDKVLSD